MIAPVSWRDAASLPLGSALLKLSLPPVTMTQLVFYCGAAGVTDPIHFDRDLAKRTGFRDAVVNGSLRVGWMAEAVGSLIEPPGAVTGFKCSHLQAMYVGDVPQIEVRLKERNQLDTGGFMLTCAVEIRVGEQLTDRGEAQLRLPTRGD